MARLKILFGLVVTIAMAAWAGIAYDQHNGPKRAAENAAAEAAYERQLDHDISMAKEAIEDYYAGEGSLPETWAAAEYYFPAEHPRFQRTPNAQSGVDVELYDAKYLWDEATRPTGVSCITPFMYVYRPVRDDRDVIRGFELWVYHGAALQRCYTGFVAPQSDLIIFQRQ